jgi:hypothetical protein
VTSIDLGRPLQGDVVDLILDDHRRFEALLRDLRDSSSDRDAVRQAFSALHVAHALAEERNAQLDDGCGTLTQVREIVAAARRQGLLDKDGEDEE